MLLTWLLSRLPLRSHSLVLALSSLRWVVVLWLVLIGLIWLFAAPVVIDGDLVLPPWGGGLLLGLAYLGFCAVAHSTGRGLHRRYAGIVWTIFPTIKEDGRIHKKGGGA